LVEILISLGLNINAQNISNQTPLHYAAENENPIFIKILVQHGANLNTPDATPIHKAATWGNKKMY
jgi:ankyrin repeat protein